MHHTLIQSGLSHMFQSRKVIIDLESENKGHIQLFTCVTESSMAIKWIHSSTHHNVGMLQIFQREPTSEVNCKCDLLVQLNEDLVGHIDFLAQTGPFSVPIRCVTKKCQVLFFNIFTVILV